MNIEYVVNARIPTSRAQGYAIMKMCERFSALGNIVNLVVPNRRNNENIDDPFEYYKIQKNFSVNKIRSTDFLSHSGVLGKIWYWIDMFTFLAGLTLKGIGKNSDLVYTRDYLIPLGIPRNSFIALELHEIPASKTLFRWLIKRPKVFFVLTQYIKNSLVEMGIDPAIVHVIPSGVELKDFDVAASKEDARRHLGLNSTDKVAMYIGLLDEWKGYRTFLGASETLSRSGIRTVIIGGEAHHVESLKQQYPGVDFLGIRPYSELGLNQLAADVLVIPNSGKFLISRFYTSPLKVFAHMASRVPIVASDLPSMREVLNESNCFFAEADNAESFAHAIHSALNNPEKAHTVSEQAKKDVVGYDWESRAEKILKIIKDIKNHVS